MVKKSSKKAQKKVAFEPKKIILLVVLALVVAGSIYFLIGRADLVFVQQPRLARLVDIYRGFDLPNDYIYQRGEIFGEKRPYDYDAGRSQSSYQEYLRGANVDVVVKELDERIKADGFVFIDEPYKGSVGSVQYHDKNGKGEYVRLSVSSKPRNDYFQNTYLMKKELDQATLDAIDPNAGPSEVIIKVNLDDNNE